MAGVALGDIDLHFAGQAWHLLTSNVTLRGRRGPYGTGLAVATFTLRGRRATYGTGLALVTRLGPVWPPWSPRPFAWQACHLAKSTFTLQGRRGTADIDCHFAWQACHLWHWAGSGDALGSRLSPWSPRPFAWQAWHLATSTFTLRGRRSTWRHRPSLCVAGLAVMALGWLW